MHHPRNLHRSCKKCEYWSMHLHAALKDNAVAPSIDNLSKFDMFGEPSGKHLVEQSIICTNLS